MRKPAARRSPKGLLLVEAVLASVVLTAGLVLISRGLSGQLQALRRLEAQQAALAAAEDQLAFWEALGLFGAKPLEAAADEEISAGNQAYRRAWSAGLPVTREVAGTPEAIGQQVFFALTSRDPQAPGIRLMAVWPKTWIPAEWPSS